MELDVLSRRYGLSWSDEFPARVIHRMTVVFCADKKVLPGLHVAAYSLLARIRDKSTTTRIHVFSDDLDARDAALLERTLVRANRLFELDVRRTDPNFFKGFSPLNQSWTTYYRLLVPKNLDVDRYLYVDVDSVCDLDVSEVKDLKMNGAAVAWATEAPLSRAVDRQTAEKLGNSQSDHYFNAGVMLINVPEWRKQRVSERATEYIVSYRPEFHDQAALNYVLHGIAMTLDPKFNCIANMRKNWPMLKRPYGEIGRLIHFVDYPKPWDFLGEFVHPQYRLWRSVLDKTAMNGFRSWHATPSRKFPKTRKARSGYKRVLKDRLLFVGYSCGWYKKIKGVPFVASRSNIGGPAL
jgi:lipopolysaccharide biosynthesis glycosyltransferase